LFICEIPRHNSIRGKVLNSFLTEALRRLDEAVAKRVFPFSPANGCECRAQSFAFTPQLTYIIARLV
jgi:hypothetical protein